MTDQPEPMATDYEKLLSLDPNFKGRWDTPGHVDVCLCCQRHDVQQARADAAEKAYAKETEHADKVEREQAAEIARLQAQVIASQERYEAAQRALDSTLEILDKERARLAKAEALAEMAEAACASLWSAWGGRLLTAEECEEQKRKPSEMNRVASALAAFREQPESGPLCAKCDGTAYDGFHEFGFRDHAFVPREQPESTSDVEGGDGG